MGFTPKNRYLLIELQEAPATEKSTVLLPDDYKPKKSGYAMARVLKTSCDKNHQPIVQEGDVAIINRSMVEEVEVGTTTHSIVLENYVLGVID
jgi:co-chaperonin GroES (HSP10)